MASESSFHETTKAVKPHHLSKPSSYFAAILVADQVPRGPKTADDYLWIKCRPGVTVEVISNEYRKIYRDEDIVLVHDGKVAALNTSLRELDDHNDHLVAFEAIKKSELDVRMLTYSPRDPPQSDSDTSSCEGAKDASRMVSHGTSAQDQSQSGLINQDENAKKSRPQTAAPHLNTLTSTSPSVQVSRSLAEAHRFSSPDTANSSKDHDTLSNSNQSTAAAVPVTGEELTPLDSAADLSNKHSTVSNSGTHLPQEPCTARTTFDTAEDDEMSTMTGINDSTDGDEPATNSEVSESDKLFQLQNFVADAKLEDLERTVEKGVEFLNSLKAQLLRHHESSPDAAHWLHLAENLQKQAIKAKTVIGVVGNTGAGKSSVINALLDEERLLPTNTMRACTAVVTEISYNYGDQMYRAEIEFISKEDWEKELQLLFEDLLDDNGTVSRDCVIEKSDAGVAYAKIKAVYPKKTKEDFGKCSIEDMLNDVSHVLGETRIINEGDSLFFYKKLQKFVDSKEKTTETKEKHNTLPKEMEFWPLIKVVRIFVKSPALVTGAVIVDLPGVHDANQARAAVAENYVKQCTGLWIIAPIIRAVDDKAAKNLLGESFRRQLKMDGGFSSITFICSKTDDISLMEASDSLGLEEENGPAWEELDWCSRKQVSLEQDLEFLKEKKASLGKDIQDIDEQIDTWDSLRDQIDNEEIVYAFAKGKKRERGGSDGPRKKKSRKSDDDDEFEYTEEEEEEEETEEIEDDHDTMEGKRSPLTIEQVTREVTELRTTKKEVRRQRGELEQQVKAIQVEIKVVKEGEERIKTQISKVCIAGRNNYSKGAIQQDFAAGMKELDQQLAAEEDEDNFNPDVDIRDYAEVAKSLPVFCVSSRGYQKLQGRLKKDPPVPGFQTLAETEIPQLQDHCERLTIAGRTATCKRFMTNLSQLINSMTLWGSNDGSGTSLTADQRVIEEKFLRKSLANLESGLAKVVPRIMSDIKAEFGENIFDRYGTAVENAVVSSLRISERWGAPVKRENGAVVGYFWSTYKAICRRNGVYTNEQGKHDWNVQLCDPMMKGLASGWERLFTQRASVVLATLVKNATNLLEGLHRNTDMRARKSGASIARLSILQQQLHTYEESFKDIANTLEDDINKQQKEINREFVPVIKRAMNAAYETCAKEQGSGSFKRMKATMTAHVEEKRHTMFKESAKEVKTLLKAMLCQVEETLINKIKEVFVMISRDCWSFLGDGDLPQDEMRSMRQRMMCTEVMTVIDQAEQIFRRSPEIKVEEAKEVWNGTLEREQLCSAELRTTAEVTDVKEEEDEEAQTDV